MHDPSSVPAGPRPGILIVWLFLIGLPPALAAQQTSDSPGIDPVLAQAAQLIGEARALQIGGDPTAARTRLDEGIELLLDETDGPPSERRLNALFDVGRTALRMGMHESARTAWQRVYEVRGERLPAEHPDLLKVRQSLAVPLKEQGDFETAREHEEFVLEVRSRTLAEDHPDRIRSMQNLAVTLSSVGDVSGALRLEEEVLAVRTRTLHTDHPDIQKARINLGSSLYMIGERDRTRRLFGMAHEVFSRTLAADDPDLWIARQNYAYMMREYGDLETARKLEEQVLEARSRLLPPDHPDLQMSRGNLAATLWQLGELEPARDLMEQAIAVWEEQMPPEHKDLINAYASLALIIRELDELEEARDLEERVLEVYLRAVGPDSLDTQRARLNLATTSSALGDVERARELESQVIESGSRTLPEHHPLLQVARGNLAFTLAARRAELDDAASDEEHATLNDAFAELAAQFIRSKLRDARTLLLESSTREAEERSAALSKDIGRALSLADGLGMFETDPGLTRDAFVLSEATRGAALVTRNLARRGDLDTSFRRDREQLRALSAELAMLVQTGDTSGRYDEVVAGRDALERELIRRATPAGAEGSLLDLSPERVATLLGDDAALIAYRTYRHSRFVPGETRDEVARHLGAFVLRRLDGLAFVDLGPVDEVESACDLWREELSVSGSEGPDRGLRLVQADALKPKKTVGDARLRERIVDPLLPRLAGIRELIVVLDDVLHTVPFDALPLADPSGDEALLGDRFAVTHRLTTQELLADNAPHAGPATLVAVGGLEYGEPERDQDDFPVVAAMLRGGLFEQGFDPLPGTAAEAAGIAAVYEGARRGDVLVLDGRDGTRAALEARAPGARFLHVATHGWFAPESVRSWTDFDSGETEVTGQRMSVDASVVGSSVMALCGLALADANLPADEVGRSPGLITAQEISDWELSACDLAALSACDTSVGLRRAGQGVASLQKALHMAGVRSVITSLWKVPDQATKELMLEFYRLLWIEKQPKHRALWQAKRSLRNAKHPDGRPRYTARDWAGWMLTGNPD